MTPTPPAPVAPVHPVDVACEEIGNAVCGLLLLAAVIPAHAMAFQKTAQRLQRARTELDALCRACGGTVLAPTRGGVPRGSCHCPRSPTPEGPSMRIRPYFTTVPRVYVTRPYPRGLLSFTPLSRRLPAWLTGG